MSDDLVVVLPGIMGSTLARDGVELWGPSRRSVVRAIRSFGASVRSLQIADDVGDEHPGDGVVARRLMPDLHVVPGLWSVNLGYEALLDRIDRVLRRAEPNGAADSAPPNLLAFPYDWRLSNRFNGVRLKAVVEPALERLRARGGRFADARVTFVCHSMGGLVARWYVEREGGHEVTRRIVTLGTPHRGALQGLADLVNGVHKGLGALRIDLTAFARSLPSAYQLLPEYACIATEGRLVKLTAVTLPGLDAMRVADGARFHEELHAAGVDSAARYVLKPIVGTMQTTATTATIAGDRLEVVETIAERDEGGDATVPRLSATPRRLSPDDGAVQWIAARHGALQHTAAVLDQLEGMLTARPIVHAAAAPPAPVELGLRVPDLVLAGEAIVLDAAVHGEGDGVLAAVVTDEHGAVVDRVRLAGAGTQHRARLRPLPPGGYLVTVGGYGSAATRVQSIASPLVAWDGS